MIVDAVYQLVTYNMSVKRLVKAVLIDLSGTLHVEDSVIAGSQAALKRLRISGLKVKFVTNTTKEPIRILHERLIKLGFDIEKEEIFTSLSAARKFVSENNLKPLLYLEETAKEDFKGILTDDPNCVVIGLAPETFNYSPMNDAFRLLLEGAPLIAIHKARYFKKMDGLYLGPGPFVSALEYATDCKAQVVGKPEASFFLSALKDFNCDPENAVMIGDDVRDDVGGAMETGMIGILVKTGKYRDGDERKITPEPTNVAKDFSDAVEYILSNLT